MKKILFVVFAVALVAFTACTKEEANFGSNAPVGSIKFVASFDQDTKTVLNSSSKTEWEQGDLISINGVKFEAVESGAQVTFRNLEQPTGEFHEPFLAVYPYSANMTYSGSTCAGVVLSDSQEATEASFAQNAAIEMAYTNTTYLSFKNVCSVVKFKVGTDNITSVEITANNGENLAGTINLNYNNGAPIATVASGGSSKVTLSGTFNKTPY